MRGQWIVSWFGGHSKCVWFHDKSKRVFGSVTMYLGLRRVDFPVTIVVGGRKYECEWHVWHGKINPLDTVHHPFLTRLMFDFLSNTIKSNWINLSPYMNSHVLCVCIQSCICISDNHMWICRRFSFDTVRYRFVYALQKMSLVLC